jgi:hypothetical protein
MSLHPLLDIPIGFPMAHKTDFSKLRHSAHCIDITVGIEKSLLRGVKFN